MHLHTKSQSPYSPSACNAYHHSITSLTLHSR